MSEFSDNEDEYNFGYQKKINMKNSKEFEPKEFSDNSENYFDDFIPKDEDCDTDFFHFIPDDEECVKKK